ncbi:MAG TPA: ABC transporter permease [Acidimicrobiales bacterium]|jgi:branched-chain amino acid transport system permease protein
MPLQDGRTVRVATVAAPIAAVAVVQILVFPMPFGVWVQGLVLGLLGALMAVGLGLVFRVNRVVNFAQGDLGSAPAVLAFGLIGLSGVNYFLGLLTGLAAVVLVSAAVEILVIRRFARSARLMLTVATIGVSQTLIVVSLLLPNIWGQTPIGTAVVHFPWHLSLGLSPIVFTADDLVAVIVSVAGLAGVALWFRFTDLGIASRAAGDRRDRAAMLGIPVNRLQTGTWVVAGVLSFLSVFLKAAILGLPLNPTFSLTALVAALGALALGDFTDLPVVALAAVALGTLEQGVAWDEPASPTLVLAVVAGVVLLGMFFRQVTRRSGRREAGSQWALASGIRDVPAAVGRLVEARLMSMGGIGVVLAFMITVPVWMGPGSLLEVSTLLVLAIVGCSIVVLTGWGGQVSLGQMSFAAVGAVAGALAMIDWHWDLSLALLFAGAAGMVAAVVVGVPTLRLDGFFVAVTTLAFGLAVSGYLLDRAEFSWIPSGQLGTPRIFGVAIVSETGVFVTCLGVCGLVVVAMGGLRHSRFGRVLRALSTNERAAASYGVGVDRAKLTAFGVSGFIAGVAGCLLVVVNQQYVESPFTETISLAVFTATAVGGLGSVVGAVLGAALVEGSAVFLPPSWQLFPSAFGVVLVLLAFPGGLASLLYQGRDRILAAAARRHGIAYEPGGRSPVIGLGGLGVSPPAAASEGA